MLKIAYCDDMETDRNRILNALGQIEEKWREGFEITFFSSSYRWKKSVLRFLYIGYFVLGNVFIFISNFTRG